jgi:hypothetical protein
MIETYTDGADSEGMPETYSVVEHHKQMARQVILGNDRLRAHFGHWLDENCRPM